jgi:hypothetical protein
MSSVLSSNMSTRDIRDIAEALRSDLSYELSDMMYDISDRLMHSENYYPDKSLMRAPGPLFNQTEVSGLHKMDVYDLMRQVAGEAAPRTLVKYSLNRMLSEFRERASDPQWKTFEKRLQSMKSEDPFLKGISKRG